MRESACAFYVQSYRRKSAAYGQQAADAARAGETSCRIKNGGEFICHKINFREWFLPFSPSLLPYMDMYFTVCMY
jgi:hypothetical protein